MLTFEFSKIEISIDLEFSPIHVYVTCTLEHHVRLHKIVASTGCNGNKREYLEFRCGRDIMDRN